MENLFLGVPILKHITGSPFTRNTSQIFMHTGISKFAEKYFSKH